ncbi:MAG: ABC transporter ATP-binding protein [Pirellulaceae bacterium]|nr:ABC transporter ATP-binding protein [Pirellulaceae bacterium]
MICLRSDFTSTETPVPETIVDVRDLRKLYRSWSWGRRRNVDALRGVTLQAQAGEVFGLLGPNGAGKTTLIKILLGVVKPTKGAASLFELPVGSSLARQRVGYLPESLRVDRHHTARSALRYYGRMSRMDATEITRRSDELLDLVGLRGRDKESVRRFSKGMYQRLGLAQALMHDPDLLVLDEPTDGLDPVGRNEVRQVIERLSDAGKTIFLNSHILQEVELVCTRVAIMAAGEIRAIGKVDELTQSNPSSPVVIRVHANDNQGVDLDKLRHVVTTSDSGATPDGIRVLPMGGDDRWQIEVTLRDQAAIDAVVDQLRSAHLSISHLETPRPSLEDTFIRLVGNVDPQPKASDVGGDI